MTRRSIFKTLIPVLSLPPLAKMEQTPVPFRFPEIFPLKGIPDDIALIIDRTTFRFVDAACGRRRVIIGSTLDNSLQNLISAINSKSEIFSHPHKSPRQLCEGC